MDKLVFVFLAFLVCLLACLVFWGLSLQATERAEWSTFSSQHNCKIVGQEKAEVSFGVSSNGVLTPIVSAEKIGYQCDDGITYWR